MVVSCSDPHWNACPSHRVPLAPPCESRHAPSSLMSFIQPSCQLTLTLPLPKPPGTVSGSIVSISVHRNHAAERSHAAAFKSLQEDILNAYGARSPEPPVLTLRNTTQTSVTLEWDRLELAGAKLRSVEIYRNGTRLAAIPNPTHNTSTKLSSLAVDTDYTFQLVMCVDCIRFWRISCSSSDSARGLSLTGRPLPARTPPTSFVSARTPSSESSVGRSSLSKHSC